MKNVAWKDHFVNLVVVIIGITIAFSLNNWKESRDKEKLVKEYYKGISEDLEGDIINLQNTLDTMKNLHAALLELKQGIYSRNLEDENMVANGILSIYAIFRHSTQSSTYNSIVVSGHINLFKDLEVKKNLIKLYEQDYKGLEVLNGFIKEMKFQHIIPFIQENISYTDDGVISEEILIQNKFRNHLLTSEYFYSEQIKMFSATLEACITLKELLQSKIN